MLSIEDIFVKPKFAETTLKNDFVNFSVKECNIKSAVAIKIWWK